MNPSPKRSGISTGLVGTVVGLFVIAACVWTGIRYHVAINDWMRLQGYQPPAAIAQLAADTTMNDSTRRLFYVYHPDLTSDKAAFNQHCSDSEKTIVLGCYVSQNGIYLYEVSDERLRGVIQVTAAHETLHAAYERLSAHDRAHVDELTAKVFAGIADKRLQETIDAYRKKDPSVVPNELHSILGTEVAQLSDELETYYRRYFTDRQAIVRLSETYEKEFTGREQRVAEADARLAQLKTQIDTLDKTLDDELAAINAEYDRMQALKRSGEIETYNSRVAGYNRQVNTYNANIRQAQSLIAQYNDLVKERNALALEENELVKAIDSRPETIQTQ